MAESLDTPREWEDEIPLAEQLIRQAGSFLEVSDELRPRVLENARERQTQRRSVHRSALALVVLLAMGSVLQALSSSWQASPAGAIDKSVCLRNEDVFTLSAADSARSTEAPAAWNLANVFAELRHRRAKILGSAL